MIILSILLRVVGNCSHISSVVVHVVVHVPAAYIITGVAAHKFIHKTKEGARKGNGTTGPTRQNDKCGP